jgi:gliding motility-associated-like protein
VGQNAAITVNFVGTGPTWDFTYTDGFTNFNRTTGSNPHTEIVNPILSTTYSLVSVTDATCGAGTVSGSATVTVSPIAGNPATFGSETWLAYVYDDSGSPAPPAANINFNNTKYRGFLDDTEMASISGFSSYDVATDAFNLNLSNTVPVAGSNICGAYLNDYSIRLRMTKTFAAGIYTFTLGADDGVRLLVDGVSVLPAGAFNTHAFTTYNSTPVCLTAGTHNLVIEYFDRGGFSRLDFNYSSSPAPTVVSPVSLCVNSAAPTLSASSAGAIDYKWYTDAALTNPPIFTGANYTPAGAQLDMTTVGTTDFFVTAVYACGETPAAQVTVDVTSGANIILPTPPVQVCDVGGIVDLSTFVSATPAGGVFTFSGTGVSGSPNFDPTGLGNTTSTITVDYVSGTCSTSTTFDIDIVTNATITVPAGATACESGGIVDLTTLVSGNPAGGTFTFGGTGVVGAGPDFDPSGLTGLTTITVDYNIGGCTAPTQMFDIDVVPNVSLVVDNSTIVCPSSGPVDLATLVTPTPGGGVFTFTGTGVTGTQFDPSGSAGSTVVINVSYDLGGCLAASTVQVIVRSATDPLCGGPTGNCATVTITPVPSAAICSPTDGSILFNINPAVPTINNTGVRIDIVGTSATNLGVSQTNFNDPLFTGLSVGTYNYTIEYGDPSCIKTGSVTVLLGPDVVDFTVASNSVNCFGSGGGVVLSSINGSDLADYIYEVTQLGAVVSTGTITQLQSLGEVTLTGFGSGNFEIKLSQDQSATTTCPSSVQSALKPFTVTSPTANLDTLYVNKTVSVPDLPTGSMVVGISESLQEPYEVRLELTQPLFPGQVFAQDFTEATRSTLNLKVEFEAPNLFAGGYLLSLRDALGCRKDYAVTIDVDNNLMVPNIFTPNGDGVNEVFFIRNMPDGTEMMITNRWGKQVYSSKNYQNDWDGGDVADGVYYYRINAAGQSYSGWVEVLRGK